MTLPNIESRLPTALLVLRITLGIFLLQWGLEKFIVPKATIGIFSHFYGLEISSAITPVLGVGQCLVALGVLLGFQRRISYALAIAIHSVSVLATWQSLVDPFGLFFQGTSHLFMTGVPVLAGFWLIYYLRDFDTRSMDGKPKSVSA